MKIFYLVLLIILALSSLAFAEEKTEQRLEEVVVTATRTERPTEEVPAGVSVVTRKEIEETRMFNVKDAMTGIPGGPS